MVKTTKRTMFWGLVGLCQMCGGCSCVELTCDCFLPPNYTEPTFVTGTGYPPLGDEADCEDPAQTDQAEADARLKCGNLKGSFGACGNCTIVEFPPQAGAASLEPTADPAFK